MNDIKNENERLTLPFVPEAVIVGNGDFPSHPFPLAVLDQVPCVVCCDGATNALADSGRVPDWIVGDGDSTFGREPDSFSRPDSSYSGPRDQRPDQGGDVSAIARDKANSPHRGYG